MRINEHFVHEPLVIEDLDCVKRFFGIRSSDDCGSIGNFNRKLMCQLARCMSYSTNELLC